LASSPLSAQEVMMAGGGAKACDWWRPIEACQLTSGWDGKGMELSPDLTRYFLWAGIIAIGTLLAVLDRRWIGRPLFGILMVAGVAGGLIITRVSPFSFGGGDHYMEGVIVSAGSALALVGYVVPIIWQFARRRLGHGRP
jgi:hypothetical protein